MRGERLVQRVAAGGFGAAAALRQGRAVHRVGVGYRADVALRMAGDLRVYGARVTGPADLTLASLRRRALVPGPIELYTATLSGGWQPAATVTFSEWLDGADTDALALDPWHSTVPLEPTGTFNRIRGAAYAGSRRARRVADPVDLTGGSPRWRA